MLNISDLKTGTVFVYENEPYQVMKVNHSKQARQGAVLQTKIKNLKTGAMLERNFKASDKFDEADMERVKANFLYSTGDKFEFMEEVSYEQVSLSADEVGDLSSYIKEGMQIDLVKFEGKIIGLQIPPKVELKVTSAPPGVKGDTATGATKQITLETGLIVNAPLFINDGDTVRINTETGEYVERVN